MSTHISKNTKISVNLTQRKFTRKFIFERIIMEKKLQGKNWCFTEFDNPEINFIFYQTWPDEGRVKYLLMGLETCPDTKRTHIQGYVQLHSNARLSGMKKLSETAHWELAKGSWKANYEYCTKEGNFTELGTPTKKTGQRSDLLEIQGKLDTGVDMKDIAADHFASFVRYHKGLGAYMALADSPRQGTCETWVFIGPPGTGKSHKAKEMFPNAYYKSPQTKWWDGYNGETEVILDEHNSAWFTWDYLLRLIDPICLPFQVELKGSTRHLKATKFIFTCNKDPRDWYENPANMPALLRRIQHVWRFNKDSDGSYVINKEC